MFIAPIGDHYRTRLTHTIEVTQIARTTNGVGYGGQALGRRVVKWERRGDRILLRGVSYDVVADPSTAIAKAVEAANYDPIVMALTSAALASGFT